MVKGGKRQCETGDFSGVSQAASAWRSRGSRVEPGGNVTACVTPKAEAGTKPAFAVCVQARVAQRSVVGFGPLPRDH